MLTNAGFVARVRMEQMFYARLIMGRRPGVQTGSQARARAEASGSRFYDRVLTQEEIAALAGLAASATLTDEIGLLRVLILRKLQDGADLADISKAIDALGRALKVQKQISAAGHRALQDAMAAVLEELSNE